MPDAARDWTDERTIEICAVSAASGPDWRWRIAAGNQVQEESAQIFKSVDAAFDAGRLRLSEILAARRDRVDDRNAEQ